MQQFRGEFQVLELRRQFVAQRVVTGHDPDFGTLRHFEAGPLRGEVDVDGLQNAAVDLLERRDRRGRAIRAGRDVQHFGRQHVRVRRVGDPGRLGGLQTRRDVRHPDRGHRFRLRGQLGAGVHPAQEVGDVLQGVQRPELLRLHDRGVRQLVLQRAQDFHPLDRIDPEVTFQGHAQVQHVHRVARLLRHHPQQHRRNAGGTDRHHDLREDRLERDRADEGRRGFGNHHWRGFRQKLSGLGRRTARQEVGDVLQGVQRPELLRLHDRGVRQLVLQRAQDFHPLDRIDPEVTFQGHAQVQHVHRVARLLRHHPQQHRRNFRCGRLRHHEHARLRDDHHRGYGCGRGQRLHRSGGLFRNADGWRKDLGNDRRGTEVERLLLGHQLVQRPLRALLRIEELLVQLRRLLLHFLKCRQRLLGDFQRLTQLGRVRIDHRACSCGRLREGSQCAGGPLRTRVDDVRPADRHGHDRLRGQRRRPAAAPRFPSS